MPSFELRCDDLEAQGYSAMLRGAGIAFDTVVEDQDVRIVATGSDGEAARALHARLVDRYVRREQNAAQQRDVARRQVWRRVCVIGAAVLLTVLWALWP